MAFQHWNASRAGVLSTVHPPTFYGGSTSCHVLKKSVRRCDGLLKSMLWWAPSMAAEMATDSGSDGDGDSNSNSSSNGNSSSSSGSNGNGDSDSKGSSNGRDSGDSCGSGDSGSSSDNGLLGIVLICHHLVQIGNRSAADVRLSKPAGSASLFALSSSPLRQARP